MVEITGKMGYIMDPKGRCYTSDHSLQLLATLLNTYIYIYIHLFIYIYK